MAATAALAPTPTRNSGHARELAPLLSAWLMALAIVAAAFVPMGIAAIRDGVLFDNDDAMRLVQVREWMDGKSWFDLTERRVNPPEGMVSHWPRLIELPIAGGIAALDLFVERDLAERIAVVAWPCVLLAALIFGLLLLARRLFAPPTLIAAAVIVALNPLLQFQLAPGRIDHHGVQMLLLLALGLATTRALADCSTGAAAAAGAIGALMLAIGLETLPLVAIAATLFGLAWIVTGDASRRVVGIFGATLAVVTPILIAATIAPARWSLTACDALSPPWLWLASGSGLVLVGLAFIDAPAKAWHRAIWAGLAGVSIVAVFAAYWPHCLAGPLGDTDPLVRELWLADVGEAKALLTLVARDPGQFLFFLAFPLIGWLGLGLAAWRERRRAPDFAFLLAFATMALALAIVAMRGVPFASIFALFGWLYLVDRALAPFLTASLPRFASFVRHGLALAVLVAALPFVWGAIGTLAKPTENDAARGPGCGMQSDLAALAAEPRGLVLAPLRLGPRILVATHHDVVGVPYHRNNAGNRTTFETLLAPADDAHEKIRQRGVRYVAVCLGDSDLPHLTAYRSDSLLQDLVANRTPHWLTPLAVPGTIRAWRVAD